MSELKIITAKSYKEPELLDPVLKDSGVKPSQKNFLNYINNFRGIAIIWIVAGHSLDAFDWSRNQSLFNFLKFFMSNGSFLFVYISGYLFQHLLPKYHYKKYFSNKFTNVIVPYLICSLPAVIFFSFFADNPNFPQLAQVPAVLKIPFFILTGFHLAPYWFIPMICIFFIISPLLKIADKTKWFYFLLPLYIAASCLIGRGGYPPQNFIHFFSVFVFGMFCCKYKEVLNQKGSSIKIILCLILAITGITILGTSHSSGIASYFNKFFLSLLFVILLNRFDITIGKRFDFIASISFGIYFVHGYVLSIVRLLISGSVGGELPFAPNIFSYFVLLLGTLISCILLVKLLKICTGKLSRYVVGC